MGINFKPGLSIGDKLISGGKTWIWDGDKWSLSNESASGGVVGDFVRKIGDEMSGDLILKDDVGDTSTIDDSKDEATAVHKKYVDDKTEPLRQNIIELEEEIDAIAPSVDYGTWEWKNPTNNIFGEAPEPGTFYLADDVDNLTTEYKSSVKVVIHNDEWDNPGDTILPLNHTWADADVGKLIQLFDSSDPDFMLGEITNRAVDATGKFVVFTVEIISSLGQPNDNLDQTYNKYLTRINVFNAPTGDDVGVFLNKTRNDEIGLKDDVNVVYDVVCSDQAEHGVEFKLKTNNNYFKIKNNSSDDWQSTLLKVKNGDISIKGYKDFYETTVVHDTMEIFGTLNLGYRSPSRLYARTSRSESNSNAFPPKNGYGSAGEVLHSNGNKPPYWGTPPGRVDISCRSTDRVVGEQWYCSNDQALWIKVS